jgi:hypothetical protein
MKKGLITALFLVMFAGMQIHTAQAKVPLIKGLPDIIITDKPKVTPGTIIGGGDDVTTLHGVFVFPDAFDVREFFANGGVNEFGDPATSLTLKWSWFGVGDAATFIRVNGRRPVADLAELNDPRGSRTMAGAGAGNSDDGDTREFPAGSGMVIDLDPEDGDPYTLTFRDIEFSPIDPLDPTPPLTRWGRLREVVLTMGATNGTSAAVQDIMVFVDEIDSSDSLSNESVFDLKFNIDFTSATGTATTASAGGVNWVGGPSAGFGGSTSNEGFGLCMTTDLTGNNLPLWIPIPGGTGEQFIDLVDHAVYKVRTFASFTGGTGDTQPLWTVDYDNFLPTSSLIYGGASWHFDDLTQDIGLTGSAGANVIGAGRAFFDDYFAPISIDSANWRATFAVPAADPVNNMRVGWRVVDDVDPVTGTNAGQTGNEGRAGTICIESVVIECVPFSTLDAGKVAVYAKALNDGSDAAGVEDPTNVAATYGTAGTDGAGNLLTTADRDIAGGVATFSLGTLQAGQTFAKGSLSISDNSLVPGGAPPETNTPLKFFPILRGDNELYMSVASARAGGSGTDPVHEVEMIWLSRNLELGLGGFALSGNQLNPMYRQSGLSGTAANFVSFLYGNNASTSPAVGGPAGAETTLSGITSGISFFNAAGVGDPLTSGANPAIVESFTIYRIDGVDLEG